MSRNFWNLPTDPMNGSMHSQANSTGNYEPFILRELFEQTGMLHEIKATVEHVGETVNQHGLDIAELKARPGRRNPFSVEALKENWTIWALIVQLGWTAVLMMSGQPDKAERVWASSPAFRQQEKSPD